MSDAEDNPLDDEDPNLQQGILLHQTAYLAHALASNESARYPHRVRGLYE
jgi:hypothetical protein